MRENELEGAWVDDRIEAFLDGELPEEDRARFERLTRRHDGWDNDLVLARRISAVLKTMPQPACPPEVTRAVLSAARRDARQTWWTAVRRAARGVWMESWQPALAASFLMALVVVASLVGRTPPQAAGPDVQSALAEVKWTLAYLSHVGRQAGASVRHDVIEEHVVAPMQQALGTIINEQQQER